MIKNTSFWTYRQSFFGKILYLGYPHCTDNSSYSFFFCVSFFLAFLPITLAYNNLRTILFCSCVQSVRTLPVRWIVWLDIVRYDSKVVRLVRHGAIVVFHHWLRRDLSFIDWVNNIHLHGFEIWNQFTPYDKRFPCSFVAYSSSAK